MITVLVDSVDESEVVTNAAMVQLPAFQSKTRHGHSVMMKREMTVETAPMPPQAVSRLKTIL